MGDQREVSQEERLERVEQLVNRSGRVLLRLALQVAELNRSGRVLPGLASQVAELGEQLERVEQMLDGPSPLVDAAELARQLGTSRSHIYKHRRGAWSATGRHGAKAQAALQRRSSPGSFLGAKRGASDCAGSFLPPPCQLSSTPCHARATRSQTQTKST
jgi:hypothetical protein